MSEGFGMEAPRAHAQGEHRRQTRYLVVIESAGTVVARLFLDTREPVSEFDAGTEEVVQMTAGLLATRGADGPEWQQALAGHSAEERRAAEVYTLEL